MGSACIIGLKLFFSRPTAFRCVQNPSGYWGTNITTLGICDLTWWTVLEANVQLTTPSLCQTAKMMLHGLQKFPNKTTSQDEAFIIPHKLQVHHRLSINVPHLPQFHPKRCGGCFAGPVAAASDRAVRIAADCGRHRPDLCGCTGMTGERLVGGISGAKLLRAATSLMVPWHGFSVPQASQQR